MIELPEAIVFSQQINEIAGGKTISNVTAAYSPHKFAWFYGDPQMYHEILYGKAIGRAAGAGGMVEIRVRNREGFEGANGADGRDGAKVAKAKDAEDAVITFSDGVNLRFHGENDERPQKHQLLIEFEDFTAISASVQMYGGLLCFMDGKCENPYYLQARGKPSPLSDRFDRSYFDNIVTAHGNEGLSAKALLATDQRIPGLGNGVLQDILYNAGIHPKKKVKTFSTDEMDALYDSIKYTLAEMTCQGGRDTERDLFGCFGGYKTKVGKNTVDRPCPRCGTIIKKEAYMGGSIYYCIGCQKI